jgi:Zn-dependent M16 (insulinase) family peptidase
MRWSLREGGRLAGSWLAAARHLSVDVLIPQVRLQGGAYGAGAQLDPLTGTLLAQSYRDPNLERTLDVFRALPRALREAADALDDAALDTLIVGAVGRLDPYALPGATGYRALLRHLRGTEGELERLRVELLATERQDFRDLADAIEAAGAPTSVVLGPRGSLEAFGVPAGWSVREPA